MDYKEHVAEKLAKLTPIFAKASIGDFSQDLEIPQNEDDEFTQLYVGIQVMLDVIREQLAEEKENKKNLQSTKESAESEKALYEAILESMGDGAIVTDNDGKISLVNYHAQIMLGFRPSELTGRVYTDAILAVDDQGNPIDVQKRAVTIALKEGRKATSSYNYVRNDKSAMPVAITASPIILGGKTVGCIAVFRDITHEKQVDEMKNEFLSFAAHQLRTPLSTMRWNMELLGKDNKSLPPKVRERLNSMYTANKKMIGLINDLLNVSRIDQGRVVHTIQQIDIVAAIKEVATDIKILANEKMVSIQILVPSTGVPKVYVDQIKLREVLQNILSNALKFNSPLGKIEVFLQVENDIVRIMVSDSGMGIPAHDAPRIFEKFYRASNAVLGQTQGSGLGLFLVKSYVEYWGGRVWFESPARKEFRETLENKDNPGTTFYIELPTKEVKHK